jgi:hypothetical protein
VEGQTKKTEEVRIYLDVGMFMPVFLPRPWGGRA